MFIDMYLPDSTRVEGDSTQAYVPWTAAFRGILANLSASGTEARLTGAIDQAFTQSPYLRRN